MGDAQGLTKVLEKLQILWTKGLTGYVKGEVREPADKLGRMEEVEYC